MKNYFILVISILIVSCESKKKEQNVIPPSVDYKVLKEEPIASKLSLAGEITAESKHEHAFLVKGRVNTITVKEGDRVKKGQLIARLSDDDYQQAAQIARSKLEEVNDQFSRLSKMYASGSLPAADYEKVKILRQEAIANNNLYMNKLAYTKLTAALDGVVSRVWIQSGTAVSEGQPIVEISNDDTVYATIEIPEAQINKVNLKDSCSIYVRSLNETSVGSIYKINPSANRLTRSYKAKILLNNNTKSFRDGMLCNVTVFEHAQDFGITIPLSLVITNANQLHYVDLAKSNKVFRKRVNWSGIINNEVVITEGLSIGDTLLINKPLNLKEGQTIKLK